MKHLKKYKEFLVEQALPPMPGDPAAAGAAPPPPKEYLFAFVGDRDDSGIRRRKYPDGSVVIEYPTYSVTEPDLNDWIKKNVTSGEKQKHTDSDLEVKQKNLIEIVKGKKTNVSDTDLTFIEKLKNAVTTDIFGNKEAVMEVVFTQDGSPTTNAINVTFIRTKK
jgi:hypothetical protein